MNRDSEIKGIVQIIHGMAEYSERYIEFADFLKSKGYIVVLSDHYAHGKKAYNENKLGVFEKSFDTLIVDQLEISKNMRKLYPKINITILGHSMGSFIAQEHMRRFKDENTSYIFMGSCYQRRAITWLGKILFKIFLRVGNIPKSFYNLILFLGVNSRIKDRNKSKFSWLSRDEEVVKKFQEDRYCGFIYSTNFYSMFLDFIFSLNKQGNFVGVDKRKEILIISGDSDPIGNYGLGVKKLYNYFLNEGFKDIELKLYRGARHEILNELNKKEVYQDILKWLEDKRRRKDMKRYKLKTEEELIIREAVPEEAEEFLAYVNQCGKETDFLGFGKEGIGLSIEEEKNEFKNFTSKNFMLVAVIDGKIVGSCSLRTRESRVRLQHRGTIGITILKEYWGRGIGRYLFEVLIERAKNSGMKKLELEVRTDNERAIALYKKMGFEIEGQIKSAVYIDGEYFDNFIMGNLI